MSETAKTIPFLCFLLLLMLCARIVVNNWLITLSVSVRHMDVSYQINQACVRRLEKRMSECATSTGTRVRLYGVMNDNNSTNDSISSDLKRHETKTNPLDLLAVVTPSNDSNRVACHSS